QGDDGEAPRIGPNGNWWVGDHDLGVRAQGDDGEVPHVGPNGNWWIGDRDLEIRAQGPVGVSIVWKGELASSPLNPQPNWAYFNTTNRNAWIWNGSWYHLSERGESGAVGADGVGLVWRGSFDGFGHPDLADPQVNWAFYNTTSRRSYVFDGETWQVLARDGPQADDPSGYVFVPVTGVSLEMASLRLPGGRSRTLVANVYPANATINAVLWSSDNPAVARVDAVTGQITAVSSTGTARITAATLNGGVMATIEVEVVPGLPSLHLSIEPYERGGPTALHRTIWRNTTVSLRGIGIYEEFVFEEVSAQARGRGNSSWRYMGNKRPLRIRFDTQRPMFGSSYAVRDWTLIANTIDHSMMRNYSAYFLGALLKGQYSSPARHFLHLYMDGEYRGVYMLSSQMHGREGRFEITYNANPALSEYFLEMCLRVPGEGGPYVLAWDPVHLRHIPIGITDPRGSDLTLEHQQFVQDFILQVDYALQGRDFYEISQIIDIPSFVDYYLVQEFFKNFDAFQSSLFFSIKQTYTNPILFAGPLWDFDISSGNGYGDFALPGFEWVAHLNPYFNSLMRVNCFRELVIVRWNEIRYNQIKTMIDHIRSLTSKYEACFEHNFYRWPDKNIWWDHEEYFHREHVEVLIDWFEQRWIWLDWWFSQ
ncbi:MAG: CotH kinase family protein, partial [Treponema sp.]|nr:CotH kinase family protein [Treponema sp.]